jgi:adenylate kinase family enzyme
MRPPHGAAFLSPEDDVPEFPPLEGFGNRIMICGPSNAGKSTLTLAVARKLGIEPIHLDLLRHAPYTNWVPIPAEDFAVAHEAAIEGEGWVIEGNYAAHYPTRLARATGIILLGSEPWRSVFRYARRTLFEGPERAGQLEGGTDRLKWSLARYILLEQPPKHGRDREILRSSGLPFLELGDMRALNRLYAEWGLTRG